MKILMIAPTPFFADRGCHIRIYEEAQALKRLGHKVKIVTYHIGSTPKDTKVIRIPKIFFWYKKLEAGPSWWKPFLDLTLLVKTAQIYLREDFDIIHAHLHEGALIGYLIKFLKRKKTPLIFDFQGSLTGELLAHHFIKEHQRLHGFFKFMETKINNLPDYLICSSAGGHKLLIEEFGISPEKVMYIRDGVGHGFYKIPPKKLANVLRRSLKIPADRKIVFFMGVLSEYQGIDILLKSVKDIISKRQDVHFLILGYPNVEYYQNIAEKYRISDYITFTGRIPYLKTHSYISLADVAVSPKISKTEANGKLYYYAAAGIPTVIFDSPVNKEILGELGIYAKFNNQKDYSEKLMYALNNKEVMKDLSLKLKKKAIKDFSWSKSIKDVVLIYKKLLKKYAD